MLLIVHCACLCVWAMAMGCPESSYALYLSVPSAGSAASRIFEYNNKGLWHDLHGPVLLFKVVKGQRGAQSCRDHPILLYSTWSLGVQCQWYVVPDRRRRHGTRESI